MHEATWTWTLCAWCVLATVAASVHAGSINAISGRTLRLQGGAGCLDCFGAVPVPLGESPIQKKEAQVHVKGAAVVPHTNCTGLKVPKHPSSALRLVLNKAFLTSVVAASMLVKVKCKYDAAAGL